MPILPYLALSASAGEVAPTDALPEDLLLWLEEVDGERAMDWVRERDQQTAAALEDPELSALEERLFEIYGSPEQIPYVERRGGWYYNLWTDAEHPRGLWRRTRPEEYAKADPNWEVLIDLDALGASEGESWVWGGSSCLRPDYRRCLLVLSRGGSDASVIREFDVETRAFVEGGFVLPEAKSDMGWIDADTVFVGTDTGEGSMTESGYPRIVRRWRRGTPLSEAEVVFEGQASDVWVSGWRDDTPGYERDFVTQVLTFFSDRLFELRKGRPVQIEKPDDASATVMRDWLLLELRSDWTVDGRTWRSGSLLAAPYERWLKGKRKITPLFEPDGRTSLSQISPTANHLLLTTLSDVKTRIEVLTPGKKGWSRAPLPGVPELGTANADAVDDESDDYWLWSSDFLTPSSLSLGTVGQGPARTLKQLPAFFDTTGLVATQHFAASDDGTRIPYFQVARADLTLDGSAPTLISAYGGFEVSMTPYYSATVGLSWLSRGGVYVVANIRGGGEYGPAWHQAALRENRPRAYQDLAAVARDLVARKVTAPSRLGATGGSNGGLLMGNLITRYPELFGAIVCQVPLLDMSRYHLLLAGASWMEEYGDPEDPEQWKFIRTFSPYHNLAAGVTYPKVLFTTSTRDDRVHPGHARKMAARMEELGANVLFYENIEGGHGGAADNRQEAHLSALAYQFLWKSLSGAAEPAPEASAGGMLAP